MKQTENFRVNQLSLLSSLRGLTVLLTKAMPGTASLILLLSSSLFSSVGLAITPELPDLGGSNALITPAQERQLGHAWLRSLRRQVATFEDPLAVQYVKDITYQLAPYSQLSDRSLSTVIVDSNELNAFAVPGGVIGINAGLFLFAKTEQEFSSVIAHEMAHLSQRHFARRLEESQNQTALSLAGILASLIVAVAAGSDAGVAALAGSQAYSVQNQLNYSRLNEQEADRIGLETLAAIGMEVRAMPAMFGRMLRTSRFNRKLPEYLRTHPLTESRVADTASRAAAFPAGSYIENIDYYLVKSRVWLSYAQNPEEALEYFKAASKNSDPHQFYFGRYGEVKAAIALNRPEQAEAALEDLIDYDKNRISVVILRAEWLRAMNQTSAARTLLHEHLKRNPGNFPLSRLLADIETSAGNHQVAQEILFSLIPEYEQEPHLWYEISEVTGLAGNIPELHKARAEFFYLTGRSNQAVRQLQQALKKVETNYLQTQVINNRIKQIKEEQINFDF